MNGQQTTGYNESIRKGRFNKGFFRTAVIGFAAAASILGGLTLVPGGIAEAHTASFAAGYHQTNGARCDQFSYNVGTLTYLTFRAPTIYATPYDNYSDQAVAWQPRFSALNRYTGQYVSRVGKVQYGRAFDTAPAAFTDQALSWDTTNSKIYLYIDFYFYSRATGALVESSSHYLGYCY